ncbi:hypothetical protein CY34DRAFT_775814 [Suillus luteus UH-Slu-Lm8-n1]|uniref:Uncharacterized protein n=1 Tax=Suillus luteus UH-Slu-Lm8-n1 TaxID=930992 RepID=A0A0D0A7N4_9AGAM|nr:hypothetical protein CY34DRAFT_775814 [Suillus luteus UH-Slu-Lm8-n1]
MVWKGYYGSTSSTPSSLSSQKTSTAGSKPVPWRRKERSDMPLKMNHHVLFVHEQCLWQGPEDLRKDKNPLEFSAAEFRVATMYMRGREHPFDFA